MRTIYRVVEYFDLASLRFSDPDFDPKSMTPLVRYEWFFYVFEAALMLINLVMMNVRHPRKWLPEDSNTYLAVDGSTEKLGPGWKDPRPFWQTVVDPFDVTGMVRGNKVGLPPFWLEDGIGGPQKVESV